MSGTATDLAERAPPPPDTSFAALNPPKAAPSAKPPTTPKTPSSADIGIMPYGDIQKKFLDVPIPETKAPEPYKPPKPTSPEERWGSAAMSLAVLGSFLTRRPLTNALNSMKSVNEAYTAGDTTAAETAYKNWKAQMDYVGVQHKFQMDAYDAAMKKGQAAVEITASALKDPGMVRALAEGGMDGAAQYQAAVRQQAKAVEYARLAMDDRHFQQTMALDNRKADAEIANRAAAGDKQYEDQIIRTMAAIVDQPTRQKLSTALNEAAAAGQKLPISEVVRIAAGGEVKPTGGAGSAALGAPTTAKFVQSEMKDANPEGQARLQKLLKENPTPTNQQVLDAVAGAVGKAGERAGATLPAPALEWATQQYLRTGSLPNLGWGAAGAEAKKQIITNAATIAAAQGHTVGDYLSGQATLKADQRTLATITSLASNAEAYERNTQLNMSLVDQLIKKGGGTGAGSVVNRWLQAGRQATGDPDVAALDAAMKTVATDYAKVMTGSTGSVAAPTDSMNASIDHFISSFQAPEQVKSVFDNVLRPDMESRIRSYKVELQQIQNDIRSGSGVTPTNFTSEPKMPGQPPTETQIYKPKTPAEAGKLAPGTPYRLPGDPETDEEGHPVVRYR